MSFRPTAPVTASLGLFALCVGAGCDRSKAFRTPAFGTCPVEAPPREHLRVVSFNIRSGLSSSIDEVAAVIDGLAPDVVALQEVDVGVDRTHRVDQAAALAQRLGAAYVFAGAITRGGGDYGVALLSRLPFTRAERLELGGSGAFEPRVAIAAGVCVNGGEVRVVALHADIFPWSAGENTHSLAKQLEGEIGHGVIVLGDLNETPDEGAVTTLTSAGLVDVLRRFDVGATFPGNGRRLDYVLADSRLAVEAGQAGTLESSASDHWPVFAQFDLPASLP